MAEIAIGLGISLGLSALTALLFPPEDIEGPRLTEINAQNSAFGKPLPKVYGTVRLAGNVMDADDFEEVRREEEVGKGFFGLFGGQDQITYEYYQTFAIGLCEGTADILRIWANNELIYDNRSGQLFDSSDVETLLPAFEGETTGSSGFTFYRGTSAQNASPILQAVHGAASTPAYRDTCYVVFERYRLENGQIPNFEFELTTNASNTYEIDFLDIPSGFFRPFDAVAIDPLRPYCYAAVSSSTGMGLVKYDKLTGAILAYRDNPWQDYATDAGGNTLNDNINPYIAVDPTGYIWMVARGAGKAAISRYAYRINPNTLLAEDFIDNIVGTTTDNKKIAISFHSPYEAMVAIIMEGSSQLIETFRVSFAPDPITGVIDTKGTVASLQTIGFGDIPGTPQDLHWDDQGRLWILSGDQIHKYLVTTVSLTLQSSHDLSTVTGSPSVSFTPARMTYWLDANSLIIAAAGAVIVWNIDNETGSIPDASWSIQGSTGWSPFTPWLMDDRLAISTGGNNSNVSVYDFGAETEILLKSTDYGRMDVSREVLYEPTIQAVWFGFSSINNDDGRIFLPRLSGAGVTLQSIVEDITTSAATDQRGVQRIAASEYNFTALTDTVRGFKIDRRMSGRAAIEILQKAFFFDVVESDWVLKGVKRGAASALTIAQADLGAATDPNGGQILVTETIKERELPRHIDVNYLNPDRDGQEGSEHASRESNATQANQSISLDLPIYMTADEAATVALRALYMAWRNRETYKWTTTRKHMRVDPSDVITLTKGSSTFETRVSKVSIGPDGVVAFEGVSDDSGIYSRTASSDGGLAFKGQSIALAGPTELFSMDLPLLSEADDNWGFYQAANSAIGAAGWTGALSQSSTDGVAFTDFVPIFNGVTFGWTDTALPDPPTRNGEACWTVMDKTSTVDIRLIAGTIASKTYQQVLDWGNLCVIGNEVLQFQTATQVDGNLWRLSNLLRGRLGSESFVTGHLNSERFVVVSAAADGNIQRGAAIVSAPMEGAAIGSTRFYRPWTFGQSAPSAAISAFANTGVRKKPYAPFYIQGIRAGSPEDLTITWLRRDRFRGKPLNDAPMSEASERYEIDIIETGSPDAVLRTLTSTSESVVYTEQQQRDDGFTPGDGVTVKIYQMGHALIGRGYAGTATV